MCLSLKTEAAYLSWVWRWRSRGRQFWQHFSQVVYDIELNKYSAHLLSDLLLTGEFERRLSLVWSLLCTASGLINVFSTALLSEPVFISTGCYYYVSHVLLKCLWPSLWPLALWSDAWECVTLSPLWDSPTTAVFYFLRIDSRLLPESRTSAPVFPSSAAKLTLQVGEEQLQTWTPMTSGFSQTYNSWLQQSDTLEMYQSISQQVMLIWNIYVKNVSSTFPCISRWQPPQPRYQSCQYSRKELITKSIGVFYCQGFGVHTVYMVFILVSVLRCCFWAKIWRHN